MKKLFISAAGCLLTIFSVSFVSAQTSDNWIRVQSEDGEFSIEVPRANTFFYDLGGFSVGDGGRDIPLKKMEMLNAIIDGCLLSFERYEADKRAIDRIYESDDSRKNVSKKGNANRDGIKIKQLVSKTDVSFVIRQYFSTKKHVYVLTAGSRSGETETINRFLNSLVVRNGASGIADDGGISLSKLPRLKVEIDTNSPKPPKTTDPDKDKLKKVDDSSRLLLLNKPLASYVDAARKENVQGTTVLRATFDKDGSIPKIAVIKPMPAGLTRQAIFGVLRIKFLPQLKDGQPETTVRTIEYSFSIF